MYFSIKSALLVDIHGIDLNGEDVWWKEDAVKWTYTRK